MNDVIQIFRFPSSSISEFSISDASVLKNKKVFASLDEAGQVLGSGVSLEIIRVHDTKFGDQYVKVYFSKHATCCVLAEQYKPRRSI